MRSDRLVGEANRLNPALAVEELRSPALSVGFFYFKTLAQAIM